MTCAWCAVPAEFVQCSLLSREFVRACWDSVERRQDQLEDKGPEVWNKEGVNILGTFIGSDRFFEAVCAFFGVQKNCS